jgi:hypothetical protein
MKKTKYKLRIAPLVMAVVMLFEVFYPTSALALTSGSVQAETQSFEPIGTTQLVDPFTGDFNYNIGLLTVPGPNGGYPVNLSYHAGISPEMEASWVGLGWNLNAGALNRNMRGLPDDFFGSDIVKKQMTIKPNWIFGLNVGVNAELLGFENLSNIGLGAGLSYNNYKGLNIKAEIQSLSDYKIKMLKSSKQELSLGFDINFDAQDGPDLKVTPTLEDVEDEAIPTKDKSRSKEPGKIKRFFNKAGDWFTKTGKKAKSVYDKVYGDPKKAYDNALASEGHAIDFENPAFSPNTSFPEGGFDVTLWAKFGPAVGLGFYPNQMWKGFLFFQHIKDKTLDFPAYGYLHSGERNRVDDGIAPYINYPGAPAVQAQIRSGMALSDFSRDNHGVNANAPNLPVPMHTFDVFSAGAQGLGVVFRPHRNDVGMLYDSRCNSDFTDIELGLELGFGNLVHVGVNPGVSYTSMYTGKWKGQYKDFDDTYEFTNSIFGSNDLQGNDGNTVFKDPFYFRTSGDKTHSEMDAAKYMNDDLVNFEMTSVGDYTSGNVLQDFDLSNYSLSIFPKIKNQVAGNATTQVLTGNKSSFDHPRENSIQYRTRFEIKNTLPTNTITQVSNLFNSNQFPGITVGASGSPIDYSLNADKKGHHLAEFSITNPDGNIYVFGLPVYNTKDKEALFSTANNTTFDRVTSYNTTNEASMNNSQGVENFYSSTETPAYATSYMLTAIYSPDYIDITSNGPSEDDFGYYVKFNYTTITASNKYKWRVPFAGAIKLENYLDNDGDDKAIYKYGEREIYYLNSIETKTHLAAFELNTTTRWDGYGTSTENSTNASAPMRDLALPLRYLDKIKLYSKANATTPIKTVHFEYDYSLCPNTINSEFNSTQNPTRGKLTLKKVFFTYLNNDKGALSPYEFTYSNFNPDYRELLSDRWGYYKEDVTVPGSGVNYRVGDFPYVDQDKVKADKFAEAWSLKQIKLPSGGLIKIEYEADDYQYVQDKKAMQIREITGTGYLSGSSIVHSGFDIDRQPGFGQLHDLVFFDLKTDLASTNQAELNKYIEGIKYMYFNANVKLKNRPLTTNKAYDYVEGYCRINQAFGIQFDPASAYTVGPDTYYSKACIRVDFQKSSAIDIADDGKLHPFRKAAFEYMKLRRPELFFPLNNTSSNSNIGVQALSAIINLVQNAGQLLTSYNKYCKIMGYGDRLADGSDPSTSDDRKSYLRMVASDGHKFGGGHRVKKLIMDNQWNLADVNATREYGQEFYYNLADGTSSGVAEYEPNYGNEENPLKLPEDDYMADRTFVARLKELYQDKPICEDYYPGANVGYSRVLIKSLTRDLGSGEINKKSAGGLTVSEYFTAKDFPLIEEKTKADNATFEQGLTIPFIGKIKLATAGFSQGFKVTSNDMHGKPRAVRVYPHNTNFALSNAQAVHEIEYTYNLNGNKLNNTVTGLFPDGSTRNIEIGVERDFVMDMNQNSQFTIDLGLATNFDLTFIPPFLFLATANVIPIINYSNNTFRTFTNVKSVYRQGILTEIKVKNDGAMTTTKNLMFDGFSGRPVLTQVNNEFNKPVYHYDMPAHWYYSDMGNKSIHYKYTSACSYNAPAAGINITYANYFKMGDRVRLSVQGNYGTQFKDYWIKGITSGGAYQLVDMQGVSYNGTPSYNVVTIVEPVNKNLLTTDAGLIVSLTNPVTDASFALLTGFNAYNTTVPDPPPLSGNFMFSDCIEGIMKNASFAYSVLGNEIDFTTGGDCKAHLILPAVITSSNYPLFQYTKKTGNLVSITSATTTAVHTGTFVDDGGCFATCLDGVLHAEAYRFKDTWTYDYADVGNPLAYGTTSISTAVNTNMYKYGRVGIWRFHEKYLYQNDRKQSAPNTDISKDGTYAVFNYHNWFTPGITGTNKQWSKTMEVTKYNPYGFEIESKDWLNQNTSILYGYNNKVALAMGSRCPYAQLSSMSFEDQATASFMNSGHVSVQYVTVGPMTINTNDAHTGNRSLQFGNQTLKIMNLQYANSPSAGTNYHIVPGQKYVLSAWIKNNVSTALPALTFPGSTISSVVFDKDVIDGWRRMEVVFSFNSLVLGNLYNINIAAGTISNILIDDIRIQPFNSQVKTLVYDPVNLNLLAELDDKNFATFYNYDEAGALVQIKKETDKGIVTVKSSRENISR